MSLLIKNGQWFNNDGEKIEIDILIENSKIVRLGNNLAHDTAQIIDATGLLVTPGLVDLHVHLREPGGEKKETIETGTKAAARGGFTTIAAMPNTRPVPDSVSVLEELNERIQKSASVRVLPYAAITVRELGQQLTDFARLKEHGAFAFTDDGVGIQSADMMLQAMKLAAELDMAVVAHCEENTLIHKGCVHEGEFSRIHNLPGIPSVCESVHIARDVLLAEATGCHYHVCHISTKESVRVVRDAKRAGIKVTAEVTPHHLLLCEDDIPGLDSNYKMNPPLRSREDQEALIEGLLDGTIDFIATDHAPHTQADKAEGMQLAPFGIVGLETAFPLLYTYLVLPGVLTLKELIDHMTINPASAFNLSFGRIEVGAVADLALIDTDKEEIIDPKQFLSKGRNTPFTGWKANGWPVVTIASGEVVWQKEGVHQ